MDKLSKIKCKKAGFQFVYNPTDFKLWVIHSVWLLIANFLCQDTRLTDLKYLSTQEIYSMEVKHITHTWYFLGRQTTERYNEYLAKGIRSFVELCQHEIVYPLTHDMSHRTGILNTQTQKLDPFPPYDFQIFVFLY